MQPIIKELYKLSLSTPDTIEEKSEVLEKTKNFFEELPPENLLPLPSDTQERNAAILRFSEVPRSSSSGMSSSNMEEESSSKEMLLLLVGLNQLPLLPQDMGELRGELERAIKNFLSPISSEDLPVEGEMRETLMRLSKLLISSLDVQERQKKTLIAVLSFLNGISFKILEGQIRTSREMGRMMIKLHELSAKGLPDTEEERIKVILAALKKEVALLDRQEEEEIKKEEQIECYKNQQKQ
jgi:hypothetical protein